MAVALLLTALGLAGCAAGTATPAAQGTTRTITGSAGPILPTVGPTTPSPASTSPPARPPHTVAPPVPAGSSGITGITTVNTCPVQRAETSCPGHVVTAQLSIVDTSTGAPVASVTSSADGRFLIALRPGRYLIRPVTIGGNPPRPQNPATVTVTAGHYTTVRLQFDIGIR